MMASAARGWLAAYAVWSGIPIGSIVLLLIHRLTGGEWGRVLAPVLRINAALMPLTALAFIPVAVALPAIYPWAADPSNVPPEVGPLFLNPSFFIARATIALTFWSAVGLVLVAGKGKSFFAAVCLALHGGLISVIAVDWVLSLELRFVSSAFAAGFAIEQILSALAVAALISPAGLEGRTAGDLGGLLIATLLGTVYIGLMSYIVAWYGDLPEKAEWYLHRSEHGWVWVMVAALIAGSLIPFALLLRKSFRQGRTALRAIGSLVLVGVTLHVFWLVIPAFEDRGLPSIVAVVSLAGLFTLAFGFGSWFDKRVMGGASHAR